jgi:predicted transcriptional regulator YheO
MELAMVPRVAFAYSWGQTRKKTDCSYIGEIYKTTPDSSREVSELYEFIDKVKQNTDAAIFTINMAEKPLSEVADFLEIFVPEIKVPESVQSKSVALQVEKKTMKEIIRDGLLTIFSYIQYCNQ